MPLLPSWERQRQPEAAGSTPALLVPDLHSPHPANRQGRRAAGRKLLLSELPDAWAAHHQTEGSFIGTFDLNHVYSSYARRKRETPLATPALPGKLPGGEFRLLLRTSGLFNGRVSHD